MPLDTPTSSGPPAAYFPNPGDSIVVGIVDVGSYQQTDYTTGEKKVWPTGEPVTGKVITGLVISTSGALGGSEKANGPISPGDCVTFWAEGSKHFTWRDAVKDHGAVERGDVMLWKREADEPSTNPRYNDRKVYHAKIRSPKADDGDIVERCNQAHIDSMQRATVDTPEPAYSGGGASDPGDVF